MYGASKPGQGRLLLLPGRPPGSWRLSARLHVDYGRYLRARPQITSVLEGNIYIHTEYIHTLYIYISTFRTITRPSTGYNDVLLAAQSPKAQGMKSMRAAEKSGRYPQGQLAAGALPPAAVAGSVCCTTCIWKYRPFLLVVSSSPPAAVSFLLMRTICSRMLYRHGSSIGRSRGHLLPRRAPTTEVLILDLYAVQKLPHSLPASFSVWSGKILNWPLLSISILLARSPTC